MCKGWGFLVKGTERGRSYVYFTCILVGPPKRGGGNVLLCTNNTEEISKIKENQAIVIKLS